MRDQQVASLVGSIVVLPKNMGGNIGDCSVWCGPRSHSESPVGSEVQHTGPIPQTGSPMGNQACIVPRLL